MPKAKSDQVITHRIELQSTERELLETAILANAASKSLQGIATGLGTAIAGLGQMIAPAMGALAAWYIADKTIDEIRELGERQKQEAEEDLIQSYSGTYGAVVAWFSARSYEEICSEAIEYGVAGWTWSPNDSQWFLPEVVDDLSFANPVQIMIFGDDIPSVGEPKIPNWFAGQIAEFINGICRPSATISRESLANHSDMGKLFAAFYPLDKFGRDSYYYIQRTTTQGMGAYGSLWAAAFGWAN